jgi:hypothetical protein
MANKILLTTNGGRVMEMKDHTDYFRKRSDAELQGYYHSVIRAACGHRCAGRMENIKSIEIFTPDGVSVKTLVTNGKVCI